MLSSIPLLGLSPLQVGDDDTLKQYLKEEKEKMAGTVYTIKQLNQLPLASLKEICRSRKLKRMGNKPNLVERIIEDIKKEKGDNHFDQLALKELYSVAELNRMNANQLRVAAEKSCIPVSFSDNRIRMVQLMTNRPIIPFLQAGDDPFKSINLTYYQYGPPKFYASFTLPQRALSLIFCYAFNNRGGEPSPDSPSTNIIYDPFTEYTWANWRYSLSTICKWVFKLIRTQCTKWSFSRSKIITNNSSSFSHLPLYKHFLHPYSLLKNIRKMDIFSIDLLTIMMPTSKKTISRFTEPQTQLFKHLESLTVNPFPTSIPVLPRYGIHQLDPFPNLQSVHLNFPKGKELVSCPTVLYQNARKIDIRYMTWDAAYKPAYIESIYVKSLYYLEDQLFGLLNWWESASKLRRLGLFEPLSISDRRQFTPIHLWLHFKYNPKPLTGNDHLMRAVKQELKNKPQKIVEEANHTLSQLEKYVVLTIKRMSPLQKNEMDLANDHMIKLGTIFTGWRKLYILKQIEIFFYNKTSTINFFDIFTQYLIESNKIQHLTLSFLTDTYLTLISKITSLHTFEYYELLKDKNQMQSVMDKIKNVNHIKTLILYLDAKDNGSLVTELETLSQQQSTFQITRKVYKIRNFHFKQSVIKVLVVRVDSLSIKPKPHYQPIIITSKYDNPPIKIPTTSTNNNNIESLQPLQQAQQGDNRLLNILFPKPTPTTITNNTTTTTPLNTTTQSSLLPPASLLFPFSAMTINDNNNDNISTPPATFAPTPVAPLPLLYRQAHYDKNSKGRWMGLDTINGEWCSFPDNVSKKIEKGFLVGKMRKQLDDQRWVDYQHLTIRHFDNIFYSCPIKRVINISTI